MMMLLLPVHLLPLVLIIYLAIAVGYVIFLAIAYFVVPEPEIEKPGNGSRFIVLVPAHNEELLIGTLCRSLLQVRYPRDRFAVYVVADNCSDNTVNVCRAYPVIVLERCDREHTGKGHAISWAVERLPLTSYDAVLIVDADNVVDPEILNELDRMISSGEQAIQCRNAVGNREDSWFTQLLYVSRTIGNHLYHHSKHELGLSSYLMGNGICLSTRLLREKGWTAFSVGEDWEYYAQLILDGKRVGFALNAKVYHQESRSLEQATMQRLRWSSGRFQVLRAYGFKLLAQGIRNRDLFTIDASMPLLLPNYSLQLNLTMLALVTSHLLPSSPLASVLVGASWILLAAQATLFMMGTYLSGSYWKVAKAVFHAPFFLAWKAVIDILSATRIYRAKRWARTARHVSGPQY
ncbi:MAG: glycosyltransferase family 2 protein [Desulfomonilia bacterium]